MGAGLLFFQLQDFLLAMAYALPRTLALFAALPIFNPQLVPTTIRLGIACVFGLLVAPILLPTVQQHLSAAQLMVLVCKEAFVGFALGYAVAIPFWAFEAVGLFIDNQRGATIAATLNPLTGNDSSPLGILFNQAFIVLFFICGGFTLVLGILFDSFRLWPVAGWAPTLRADAIPLLLAQLDRLVRLALLYGSPVIVTMFLAELGLALISRFVPQLQVFFLAMPIKSALAILVLMMYCTTLLDFGRNSVEELTGILPALQKTWDAQTR